MGESAAKNPSAAPADNDHGSRWQELRELLAGPERRKLDEILTRLNDPVRRAEDFGQALPDAIRLSHARSDRMARALQPAIDAALKVSVEKDPKAIAEAIFPALGPAIRKAISTMLLGMIQSLNHLLNQSFSLQGFKWRLQALRSGKSFAEVMLLHTLVYRVEQIFLIHRKTGLVLQHVASRDVLVRDADVVSGMLTAIQDFIQDAFESQGGEMLDTLRMDGDHSIWIEQGPEAFLAVVLRGTPPLALRDRFKLLLTEIHQTFSSQWDDFNGQVSSFAMVQPQLENALSVEFRETRQRSSPLLWIAAAVLFVLALAGSWQLYGQQRSWQNYLTLLEAQNGIVVTTAKMGWRRFYIEGLRDPLAQNPRDLLVQAGLDPERVQSRWEPYFSLDEAMVLRRAQLVLQPPAGVSLKLQEGVLIIAGQAPHAWVARMRRQAQTISGVRAYDERQLINPQMTELHLLAAELAHQSIAFERGSADLSADQQPNMTAVSDLISKIQQLRRQMDIPVQVAVIGFSDPTGTMLSNLVLSQQRAERVVQQFIADGLEPLALTPVGKGSETPIQKENDERRFSTERRVTFQTFIDGKQVIYHD
jgi:OOP family OmpA-OmpF porin